MAVRLLATYSICLFYSGMFSVVLPWPARENAYSGPGFSREFLLKENTSSISPEHHVKQDTSRKWRTHPTGHMRQNVEKSFATMSFQSCSQSSNLQWFLLVVKKKKKAYTLHLRSSALGKAS